MKKPWFRWTLKILLVYFTACTPDMWKLAMLGPPVSIASLVFILASSLAGPWVYLIRIARGEIEYLPAFAPFAVIFTIGAAIAWWTERKRVKETSRNP